MTTQSKSVLMPFLIIAGIVFAVALAWKYLGNHDTKTVVTETVEPMKTEQVTTTPVATTLVPTVVDYDEPAPYLAPTVEDREKLREQAVSKMKFSMRYPSLESAMTGLKQLRANGNDEIAENLIRYIEDIYPNDTIPVDLLD
ncbi:hypothetical protein MNBD_GAMMA02-1298 [hydrothermal vent metagenome]|uniref:Uncharacterized protein n=1 Tax=hydrothermal vent metagenome TaxID=652676 RepID=A0A3B0W080_9ZZZZ